MTNEQPTNPSILPADTAPRKTTSINALKEAYRCDETRNAVRALQMQAAMVQASLAQLSSRLDNLELRMMAVPVMPTEKPKKNV